jgi:hypothetical protein
MGRSYLDVTCNAMPKPAIGRWLQHPRSHYSSFGAKEATILDTNLTNPHEPNRESSSDWCQFVKLVSLFRRERLYDFFEARIAAERVPEGVQF